MTIPAARVLAIAALACASLAAAAGEQSPPLEPADYRREDYRAKVPATLAGARVVSTRQAFEMWQAGQAVFVDALPRPPKPKGLPPTAVWRDQPRFDIPGSIWLPDTGYGELAPATLRYFENGLEQATGKSKTKPLVFYCLADCWMSWNAAKRALSLGYSNVSWYPQGTDGWSDAGHPLEPREPEPRSE
jgi:PQQ-dependent catabolism-associated CXXCW motif protein